MAESSIRLETLEAMLKEYWSTEGAHASTYAALIQAHALMRIADAIETLTRLQVESSDAAVNAILEKVGLEQAPPPLPQRCSICQGTGFAGEAYCDCQTGKDLKKMHYRGL